MRGVISSIAPETTGWWNQAATASTTWPSANLALIVPCPVRRRVLVTKFFVYNGATASGNLDIGLYDSERNRVVSTGTTAQAGTSAVQTVDCTDTWLAPGMYFLALAMDGTTGTITKWGASLASQLRAIGVTQAATSFVLPATITPAAPTGAILPLFGALLRRTTV